MNNQPTAESSVLAQLGKLLFSWPVRVGGTVFCLWLISRTVDLSKAWETLRHLDRTFLALAFLATCTVMMCAIAEWGVLVRAIKNVSWPRLALIFFQMLAPAALLPAGIAGEAVRIYRVSDYIGVSGAAATAVIARICSSLAMAIWAFIGSLQLHGEIAPIAISACSLYLMAMIAVWSVAFYSERATSKLLSWLGRINQKVAEAGSSFVDALKVLGNKKTTVISSLAFSLAGWGINFLALHLFAASTGADVAWYLFAIALPLSLMATLAPFVFHGIGLREGILVWILMQTNVPGAPAAVIALLVDLQMAPFILFSALLWLLPAKVLAPRLNSNTR